MRFSGSPVVYGEVLLLFAKIWREGGEFTSICITYLFSDIGGGGGREREPMIHRHDNLKQTSHSSALPLTWGFQRIYIKSYGLEQGN